ncbi:MAG: hypothetical protein KDC46_02735 [Thermoleophilia bacterium]|nr:hypothetical protein [Thermoleophilia bacterium]
MTKTDQDIENPNSTHIASWVMSAILVVVVLIGTYFMGGDTGADLASARADGREAGVRSGSVDGAARGRDDGSKKGDAEGFAQGKKAAFASARKSSYRRAYRRAYDSAYKKEKDAQAAAARAAEIQNRIDSMRANGIPACNDPAYLAGLIPGVCTDPNSGEVLD